MTGPAPGGPAPAAELDLRVQARVTLVTVSYNSALVLPKMLASLPPELARIVVDNGCSDATPAVAATHGARLVTLGRNQGFGRGCNAGAAVAETEFLFFVNPDAVLLPGCTAALVAAADAHPHAAAFNPRIVKPSGRVEFKHRSPLLWRGAWIGRKAPQAITPVPVLAGGALFVRRRCFEQVGGFDPAIFLFHEDDDLSIRLKRDCGPLLFVPGAGVRHRGGHSSGRSPAVAHFKGFHMARSRIYTLGKFGRSWPWLRTLGDAAFQLALPHNFLSARRRAKHWGQVRGALSAYRDGGVFSDV